MPFHLPAPTPRMHRMRPSLALAVTLTLSTLVGQAMAARVVGYVRDAQTQAFLYSELHEQNLGPDGAVLNGVTTYHDAQGKVFARKTLDFRQHRSIPLYTLQIPAQGYSEGLRQVAPKLEMFKRSSTDGERSDKLSLREGLVAADEGFNQLVQDQLGALSKGDTVGFTLVVAGYLDQFRFRARAASGKLVEAGAAAEGSTRAAPLVLRVEPDSLLRMLVAPITLSYDARTRQLQRYEGVSNILNPATGKVYERVRIDYGVAPPDGVKAPTPD
jgi:hypothetical protein